MSSEGREQPRETTQHVEAEALEEILEEDAEAPAEAAAAPSHRPPPLPWVRRARKQLIWGSAIAAVLAIGAAIAVAKWWTPGSPGAPRADSEQAAQQRPPHEEQPAVVDLGAVVVDVAATDAGTDATAQAGGVRDAAAAQ